MTTCLRGLDAIVGGLEIVGTFNLQTERAKMNGLKVVTLAVAQNLLDAGQQAIDAAIAGAKQPWYKSDLPLEAARDKVLWQLKWYADDIAKTKKAAKSPNDIYASGADLKERVLQAYIEWNAVEAGSDTLDRAWAQMWIDIGKNIAAIPGQVAPVTWYLKSTYWIVAAAGVLAVGLIAWGVSSGVKHRLSGR